MPNDDPSDCDRNGCDGISINSSDILDKVRKTFESYMLDNVKKTKQDVQDMSALRNLESDHEASHELGIQMMVTTFLFGQMSTLLTSNAMGIILKTTNEIGRTAKEWGKEG